LSLRQDLSRREGAGHSISFPLRLEDVARAKARDCDTIEIWFADETRIGQKNKITRRWAKRGTRPSAPRDQRTCTSRRSPQPLNPASAVLLVDQAGWHVSTRLIVPADVTIITLQPKCPELNPVENVGSVQKLSHFGLS
jgi:hypothetical protein